MNIKVKPSKLRVGKEVIFGGFQCKATGNGVEIQPDPSRLEAIANISPPKNKTDVRAFLGMVRQMEAWSPNLSFASKNMRMQTLKSTTFQWNRDCQEEFLKIKEIISKTLFLSPFDINFIPTRLALVVLLMSLCRERKARRGP